MGSPPSKAMGVLLHLEINGSSLCNLEAKDKTIDSLLITIKHLVLINILSFISSGNYLKLSNKNHDTWLKCMHITFIGSLLLWCPVLIHVSIHECLRDTHKLIKKSTSAACAHVCCAHAPNNVRRL